MATPIGPHVQLHAEVPRPAPACPAHLRGPALRRIVRRAQRRLVVACQPIEETGGSPTTGVLHGALVEDQNQNGPYSKLSVKIAEVVRRAMPKSSSV